MKMPGSFCRYQFARTVLKGLKGVYVIVADDEPGSGENRINKRNYPSAHGRTQLRRAGIKILSKDEWSKEPAGQFLSISVDAFVAHRALSQDRRPSVLVKK